MVKASEHGLGHPLNPADPERQDRDWIAEIWSYLVRRAHDLPVEPPEWTDRPAIGRTTVSSSALPQEFSALNADKPYPDRIKPFNFLSTAFVDQLERAPPSRRWS